MTVKEFFCRFFQVTIAPDAFFKRIRLEKSWSMPLLHLLVLAGILSLETVLACTAGVLGDIRRSILR
jgi:hypothetical protein